MSVSSTYISDNEIELELKPYIEKLGSPCSYDLLLKLAKNISQKEALVYLDLVGVISVLSTAGKAWVEEISWDSGENHSNTPWLISEIESKNLEVSSAKKVLIWINIGFEVPVSEVSLLQDQITSIGGEITEYYCGICMDENNADLFECMVLVGGLELIN